MYTEEFGDNEDDIIALASNEKRKEFVKIYGELEYHNLEVKFFYIKIDELEKQIKKLRKKGYQELPYGIWNEEES